MQIVPHRRPHHPDPVVPRGFRATERYTSGELRNLYDALTADDAIGRVWAELELQVVAAQHRNPRLGSVSLSLDLIRGLMALLEPLRQHHGNVSPLRQRAALTRLADHDGKERNGTAHPRTAPREGP